MDHHHIAVAAGQQVMLETAHALLQHAGEGGQAVRPLVAVIVMVRLVIEGAPVGALGKDVAVARVTPAAAMAADDGGKAVHLGSHGDVSR